MIDIHTHILPGLDDGACSLEEALGMLRMASAAGTTDMVASSHANPQFAFDPHVAEERIADLQVPKNSSGILGRMIDRGLHPIVAHPERNPILRTRMSELETWVGQGCSMQVTASSLLGRFGKSAKTASHQLMARGLVHFLASDAHDLQHRPPVLDEVRRYVEETFDPEAADRLLVENPQSVLEGFPVAPGPVHVRKRPWYSLW